MDSCEFYGGTYDGARKASSLILKSKQMLPISISSMLGVYFIPTMSPESENNKWVALEHIEEIEPDGQKGCRIILTGNISLILDESAGSLNAKVRRAAQLKFVVEKRNKMKNMLLFPELFTLR